MALGTRSFLFQTFLKTSSYWNRFLERLSYTGQLTQFRTLQRPLRIPSEFLNFLDIPGVPPNRLHLKVVMRIMLLSRLDIPILCMELAYQTTSMDMFLPSIPIIPVDMTFECQWCSALSSSSRRHKINLMIADIDVIISHRQPHAGCIRFGSQHNFFPTSTQQKK